MSGLDGVLAGFATNPPTSVVDQILALQKFLTAAQAPADKESLHRRIEATDRQIDRLV